MSTTAVNGTITFQSNGDSPVILREVAEMIEDFQRLKLPVAVTITVMLDGEMAMPAPPMPAIKEAAVAPANFPAPVHFKDGVDEMDGVDWGVTGLSAGANQYRLSLIGGVTTWRKVPKWARLELVQAVLAQPTKNGKAMTMGEFDRLRPAWMPGAVGLPTTFGCAWSELPGLRMSE